MSPIIKLPGGALRDEIRQPLYDVIDYLGGVSPIGTQTFFQSITGKDITQTNMRQAGALETAVSFRLQGMALDAQNDVFANKRNLPLIMEHSAITVHIGEKIYWKGPVTFMGGRLWQDSAMALDAQAAPAAREVLYQRWGEVAVAPIVLLGKHVVDINPLQAFRADLLTSGMTAAEIGVATPEADTKLRMIFSFKGLQRRPVQ
jgi:hypothetical protein